MTDLSIPVASVSLIGGRPATTSLAIAEHFGKRHDHVIRNIKDLMSNLPESFSLPNFGEAEYTDEQGKPRPMFIVYFDGFILLVMGYTGKKALQMKLAYIEAFNAMRAELESQASPSPSISPTDSPITPNQQCILQALVKARVESLPENQRKDRSLYPQIWSRFNNHFRLGSYRQLPQSRMSEAVDYLTRMEIRPALPAGKSLESRGADAVERLLRLRADVFRASVDVRMALSAPFFRGPGNSEIPEHQRDLANALNEATGAFFMAVNNNLIAVEQMFRAYVEAEKMFDKR